MSFVPDPGFGGITNMVETLGTAGVSAKAVESAKAEAAKLVSAAKSGGFKISEKGVEPLHKALTEMRERVSKLSFNTTALTQAPKLGSHPYGHAVAEHDQKGAATEANSAKAVLDQLLIVLQQADEAVLRAAGLYKENEQGVTDAMKAM
ncbi:hypothetical protein AB5J62_00345 [Amycolatopsis sp. cg5]|uniref:hypothetical protein n=1 Tax=Amycolatopsis sp. cg5 TaxID=3238802 RepID=UPI00352401A8